jgi:hypothetical protein
MGWSANTRTLCVYATYLFDANGKLTDKKGVVVLVARHSDFDGLIPSQLRIGKFSGGTRISMLLGAPA